MIKIKLMADYFCYPIWGMTQENMGNIDPKTLPISEELMGDLEDWAKMFDSILDQENPAHSKFLTSDDEQTFETRAFELYQRLRKELGENYSIVLQL